MSQDPPEYQTVLLNAPPPYEDTRARPSQLRHDPSSIDTAYDPGHHRPASACTLSSTRLNRVARGSTGRDYKPAALRWWFHLLLIACLGGLIALTEYAIRNLINLNDAQTKVIMRRDADVVLGDTLAVMDSLFHLDLGRADDDDTGVSTTVTVSPVGGAGPVTIAVAIPTITHEGAGGHHTTPTEVPSAVTSSANAVQTAAASWTASVTLAEWTTTWTTTWSSGEALTTWSTVSAFPIRGIMDVETVTTIWTDAGGASHTSSYETTTCRDNDTSTAAFNKNVQSAKSVGQTASASVEVLYMSNRDYLTGTFLATALAVLIAYPLNLISTNAKRMQPFHTLATASAGQGADATQSLLLRFHGPAGALSLLRALRHGQPAVALSDLLLLPAALLPPLAATAVSLRVGDACLEAVSASSSSSSSSAATPGRAPHCLGLLGVSPAAARALQALLATAMLLLAALLVTLSARRWRTGVARDPWSLAAMARLCRDPELRARLRRIPRGLGGGGVVADIRSSSSSSSTDAGAQKILGEARYALGRFWGSRDTQTACPEPGPTGYGVMVAGPAGEAEVRGLQLLRQHGGLDAGEDAGRCAREEEGEERLSAPLRKSQPFAVLTWWGRCGLLLVYSGVIAVVAYYESTRAATGLESFKSSQAWGLKFLFTAIGVALGFLMRLFFHSLAMISPYLLLSRRAMRAEQSILLSPPTNSLSGLYSAIRQRHVFLGLVSFTTLLAELCLPVTLAHVPFSRFDKLAIQEVCIWLSISILGIMDLIILASFAIEWPHLPLDPRTVAGAMFYVCDSRMLAAFEGTDDEDKSERDLDVRYLRSVYGYGIIQGVSGEERMGVDVYDEWGEATGMFADKAL